MIRDYEPAWDRDQLRACVIELQEFGRSLEPRLPRGEEMVDQYLAFMLERWGRTCGRVFVADVDHTVAGFEPVKKCVASAPRARRHCAHDD